MHTIFYFTGTGNCLSVAKKLQKYFEEEVKMIRICKENMHLAQEKYCGKVGIVYPVYSNNLPNMVLDFLQNLNLETNTYVYTIVTWGGLRGTTEQVLHTLLKENNIGESADFEIKMPHNGIVIFDAPSDSKQKEMLSTVDTKICDIAKSVKECKRASLKINRLLKLISPKQGKKHNRIFNPKKREKDFFADEKCIGCGICTKVCPAQDIELVNGQPHWKGKCENCMACFQWCPQCAIQFKNITQNRSRYHNPDIELKEVTIRK